MAERPLRIAVTADLHYGKHSRGTLHDAFAEISRSADIVLLCGDLTDYGLRGHFGTPLKQSVNDNQN
jgi:3',5'-cyclic AMP phosphodiesterase CpdA